LDNIALDYGLLASEERHTYHPRPASHFVPKRIVLAKGSAISEARRKLTEGICAAYPNAEVIKALDIPHNRITLDHSDPLRFHYEGKQTLVLAEHNSAVRLSTEEGNSCPNYWHFSPYGFCPFGCHYCYLAGTQGVRFSPTVKIFLNLPAILAEIDRTARRLGTPIAFYLGKLQDGLALDPLSGYSRQLVPFFAGHTFARLTLLTKSADVGNLLGLDHRQHTTLSWTVNPSEIVEAFEHNTPSLNERIAAMRQCSQAGYLIRIVVMPIIPVPGWENMYSVFLTTLLSLVPLSRITLGSICSYPEAQRLTGLKLGKNNVISAHLERNSEKSSDGPARFSWALRERVYRHLIETIQSTAPGLEISLCLEDRAMFDALGIQDSLGQCNCVL